MTEGGLSALSFSEVWLCDFEFQAENGNRPSTVCMVALEMHTRREIRMWRDELHRHRRAPFNTGSEAVFVAFYASAELGCFLDLGWPMPANIIDLYAEHRVATNGRPTPQGDSLLGALAMRGLWCLSVGKKETMRDLVMRQSCWSGSERTDILEYCASDVRGLYDLIRNMGIDWPRALLRGSYMAAAAKMEWAGVPIDVPTHTHLTQRWDDTKRRLVRVVDADIGVYEEQTFKAAKFNAWLAARNIPWPRRPDGELDLTEDTFKRQADCQLLHPELRQLHELRTTLAKMRLTGLQIGSDGRNRCLLSAFKSVTGRNQPSNVKCVFGPARWMRGLIKPADGQGLAYIDFASQEFAIAAALSGDEHMMAAYTSGDPYLAFAKMAGLAPQDATKDSHKAIRNKCKIPVLGVQYGQGPDAMALIAGVAPVEARELLRFHKQTFRRFWEWGQDKVDGAQLRGAMHTRFGWQSRVEAEFNPRSLMNWPMQSGGADMMRIAAIAATEAGIEVCLPVHDAFLIAAPLAELDDAIATMQGVMGRAGAAVTGGLAVRAEVDQVVRSPDRYMDERGAAMWEQILQLSHEGKPPSRGWEPPSRE